MGEIEARAGGGIGYKLNDARTSHSINNVFFLRIGQAGL